MRRGLVMIGALVSGALLAGFAAAPAKPDATFDIWGTGPNQLAYNRLEGDCDAVTHAFGRNAAWGLWVMPLSQVAVTVTPNADTSAQMTFTCRDGAACIQGGALGRTPERLAVHSIRFGGMARARELEGAISRLRTACEAAA